VLSNLLHYNRSLFVVKGGNIVFVFVIVTASAEVRCPRNASNVFADDWASQQCGQHQEHLSAGGFYELFLQHPSTERFDMLCRYIHCSLACKSCETCGYRHCVGVCSNVCVVARVVLSGGGKLRGAVLYFLVT